MKPGLVMIWAAGLLAIGPVATLAAANHAMGDAAAIGLGAAATLAYLCASWPIAKGASA